MGLALVYEKKDWAVLLDRVNSRAEFLQSWEWGEFQAQQGLQVVRLHLSNNQTEAAVQGFGTKKFGVLYWYFPRVEIAYELIDELQAWVKKTGAAWWQIESTNELNLENVGGTEIKPRQPSATWVIDLQKNEEDLLAAMHQKTRYNLNLAIRKGVEVKQGHDAALFNRLMRETAARDGFVSYSAKYYQQFLQIPLVEQLTAWQGDQALATGLFINYNGVYTYVHGASHHAARAAMAPQLLQWSAIRRARELGCVQYDFWGIAPPAVGEGTETFHNYTWSKHHSLAGVTRFKVGFGGKVVEYPAAWQIVQRSQVYKLYSWLRRLI